MNIRGIRGKKEIETGVSKAIPEQLRILDDDVIWRHESNGTTPEWGFQDCVWVAPESLFRRATVLR